jgi:hypothetical protein
MTERWPEIEMKHFQPDIAGLRISRPRGVLSTSVGHSM